MKFLRILKENNFLIYFLTFLITFQIYFTIYKNKNITLFILLIIILFILKFDSFIKTLWKEKIFFYFLFLVILSFAFFRSADKVDAFKHIAFLSLGSAVYHVYKDTNLKKQNIFNVLVLSSTFLVVLIIFTFFFEKYELQILNFKVMQLFIEPDTIKELLTGKVQNNVLENNRTGGFFVNTNIAALYINLNLGILIWSIFTLRKKLLYFLILFLFILGLICTGSIGGLYSLIMSSLFISLIYLLKKSYKFIFLISPILIIFFFAILKISYILNPRYPTLIREQTFHGRTIIWNASWNVIKNNWLLGIGLDKVQWNKYYNIEATKLNAPLNMSPHNMFLFLWGKSGILALVFFILFFLITTIDNLKRFYRENNIFSLLILFSIFLIVLQGITENILLMDIRILSVFWMIMSFELK